MRLTDLFPTRMLLEGRDAPLYHGCHAMTASKILASDRLKMVRKPTDELQPFGGRELCGVSLTRNNLYAERLGMVVFVLDQSLLARDHRIIPYDYDYNARLDAQGKYAPHPKSMPSFVGDEYEEFVLGEIAPLEKYLISIYFSYVHLPTKLYTGWAECLKPVVDHPKFDAWLPPHRRVYAYDGGTRTCPTPDELRNHHADLGYYGGQDLIRKWGITGLPRSYKTWGTGRAKSRRKLRAE